MNREKEIQFQKELYQMESDLYDIQTLINKHQQILYEMEPPSEQRKKAFTIGMRGANSQSNQNQNQSQAPPA